MILKIWKDPVWSKVIATAILAVIASFYAGWLKIKSSIVYIYSFFLATTAVPNWMLILLTIPTIIFLFLVFLGIKERVFGSKVQIYTDYVSDYFLGLTWIWSYRHGKITNLYAVCPQCSYQVIGKYMPGYYVNPRYLFECDECAYNAGTFDGEYSEIEQRIKLKIQKNIRNGEWKNKI